MGARTFLTSAGLLVAAASGALAQAFVPGESGNQVPPARFVSLQDQDGPKQAERLTLGMWVSAGNVTTYTIGNSWNDWVLWLVFDKLREPSPYVGKAEDWLATAIEQVSDDARVWDITLREGVTWHDGTPFTAEPLDPPRLFRPTHGRNRGSGHAQGAADR